MGSAVAIKVLDWRVDPLSVLAAWPAEAPVVLLHSGGRRRRWARWTVVARPAGWFVWDGRSRLTGEIGPAAGCRVTHDPLRDLDAVLSDSAGARGASRIPAPPFAGGWIGVLAYELGAVIEPAVGDRQHADTGDAQPGRPLIELAWCPQALVHDNLTGRWFSIGDGATEPAMKRGFRRVCPGPAFEVGAFSSSLDPDAYLHAIERTIGYIRAGDIFQANITQTLSAAFTGSTRRLALQALSRTPAWYGAYLELPGGRRIVSMSPELFLDVRPDRRITTRPIKGTRPASTDAAELRDSEKDAAELHMIIDLMRNDLGRVCEYGSMAVPTARRIETYGTVHHGVGEVTGRLREDVSPGDVLGATFPGGSITGAPKIRAMQIINELEPVRRGPYCGSIGYFSRTGGACLNIGIRTICLRGRTVPGRIDLLDGRLEYGTGGGIVADSAPLAEYRESLDKAAALRVALGRSALPAARAGSSM